MKLLALTRYGRLGASSRMRVYQYIPVLYKFGIEIQVSPLLGDRYLTRLYSRRSRNWRAISCYYLVRLARLFTVTKYDLVWIEKELFPFLPAWFEIALKLAGVKFIVDYDDAIFHTYDLSRHPLKRLLADKIDRVMRNAVLVICGNSYLATRALSAGSQRVEIIPTVIDLERYAVNGCPKRRYIVVGWIGSPTSLQYLEVVVASFKVLSKEYSVQLRVVGGQFSIPGVDVECRNWSEESETREIQDFDIGIMPLFDGPWERGKCGYKLIQYMACGKPVVASPVGVNREIVQCGINGYLAKDDHEWLAALRSLCADADGRREMGAAGRKIVERKYSVQAVAQQLAELLYDVATK